MTNLYLDFETASEVDLETVGLDNYAKHPSTRVLMLGWALDEEPVELWQPHLSAKLPAKLAEALIDPQTKKLAWNCPFEINIFRHVLKIDIPIEFWFDIQVQARYLSLPGGLDKVGAILGLAPDEAKDKNGTRLKNMFCYPAHLGGEQTLFGTSQPYFRDWNTNPRDWDAFCEYCKQDVVSERVLFNRMKSLLIPESEQKIWYLDQKINETGLPTAREFAENMFSMASRAKNELLTRIKEKTGLENPNSNEQFLAWAKTQGYDFGSIKKEFVVSALNESSETSKLTELGREVLKIRQEAAKQSYQKLEKLHNFVSSDGRLRNQFLYLGAARTGRWSGTGVQVQNLTRPMKEVEKKYDRALEIIAKADYKAAESEFSSVIGMTTSCLRSAFQASPGKKLVIADLNAIENRGLGWVAGCELTLNVFKEGKCPYLDFATELYGIPYWNITTIVDGIHKAKDKEAAEMRQNSKPAVLGAGYELGVGELKLNQYGDLRWTGLMGYALNMGVELPYELARDAIQVFRQKRPKIADYDYGLWSNLERAAKTVLKQGGQVPVGPVVFDRKRRANGEFILRILLPSGRHLHYINARLVETEKTSKKGRTYTQTSIMYDGIGHGVGAIDTKANWGPVYTYGGKLTENIVQAISRDVLVNGMQLADNTGFTIVGHFHDEIVCEVDQNSGLGIKQLVECMKTPPSWGMDFPLGAEGFEAQVYKKA